MQRKLKKRPLTLAAFVSDIRVVKGICVAVKAAQNGTAEDNLEKPPSPSAQDAVEMMQAENTDVFADKSSKTQIPPAQGAVDIMQAVADDWLVQESSKNQIPPALDAVEMMQAENALLFPESSKTQIPPALDVEMMQEENAVLVPESSKAKIPPALDAVEMMQAVTQDMLLCEAGKAQNPRAQDIEMMQEENAVLVPESSKTKIPPALDAVEMMQAVTQDVLLCEAGKAQNPRAQDAVEMMQAVTHDVLLCEAGKAQNPRAQDIESDTEIVPESEPEDEQWGPVIYVLEEEILEGKTKSLGGRARKRVLSSDSEEEELSHRIDPDYIPESDSSEPTDEDHTYCELSDAVEAGQAHKNGCEGKDEFDIIPLSREVENSEVDEKLDDPTSDADDDSAEPGEATDEEDVPEDERMCDKDNPAIFVRKILRSDTDKKGRRKKHNRVFNKYHRCPFCPKKFLNFAQHVTGREHEEEPDMKEIHALNRKNKIEAAKRKTEIELLRLRAAHEENCKVLQKGKGEIVLARRATEEEESFSISIYGLCATCYGWFKQKAMYRHQRKCLGRKKNDPPKSKGVLLAESLVLSGRVSGTASQAMKKEVFSIMSADEISKVAQTDELIIVLGNMWLQQNVGNPLMRRYYTSSVMRLMARLLINSRKVEEDRQQGPCDKKEEKSMWDFLKPEYFNTIVKATLMCCAQDLEDAELLETPSNAIKLGFDLKRISAAKLSRALIKKDKVARKDAKEFQQLMNINWATEVNKLARVTLQQRALNKKPELPLPEDIVKLAEFLQKEIRAIDYSALKKEPYSSYKAVGTLTLARLISYNRRRPGEMQAIRLIEYKDRHKGVSKLSETLISGMNELEKKLIESQEVVEIRGKRGKAVPVIVPPECVPALEFLADASVRNRHGIASEYIFGTPEGGVLRGYEALNTVCQKACLQQAKNVKATKLRKYMATITQVLQCTPSDVNNILAHMGHNWDVHKAYYRQVSDVVERLDIAKLLLIQDQDLVSANQKKNLGEISLKDLTFDVILSEVDDAVSESTSTAVNMDIAVLEPQEEQEWLVGIDDMDDDMWATGELDDQDEGKRKKKKPRQTSNKKRWTVTEVEELNRYFQKFFASEQCPNEAACRKAIAFSKQKNGEIHKRPWDQIKKKVNNMQLKKKRE